MEEESKWKRKFKQDPAVPIGVGAMLLTLLGGAWKYRTAKKTMSTSIFLMQLRVAAQGAVIGCITLGVLYNIGKDVFFSKEKDSSSKN